jgi:protein-S-isoprenylcysteine O-methyltransferase Ste14
MLWARMTFGMRSFHADAQPTAGGLVTSGPYRHIRHPIYAAICLFVWAGVLAHLSPLTILLGFLATVGILVRLRCEETLITERYPEYRDYSTRTKRLLPGLW